MNSKVNVLDVIPVHRDYIQYSLDPETGCIELRIPRFKRRWVQRILLPKTMSPYIKISLEEHGSAVWSLIDGSNRVSDIIKKLAAHFENEEGYESRVVTYLYQLQKDGFIRFHVSL